ncbi:MAG TPA: RuBisCO large subunit C-terminal-like domain-containing protein [Casimicrobiaceae bacterium]|nr:RuBisCO large subunit C-terminal-like domain-containing protein [Casimicrobiaceae bacterium]
MEQATGAIGVARTADDAADDAGRWIDAVYRVRCAAADIEARAQAIALEQSVEVPLAAVGDERVRREVVARVGDIVAAGAQAFDVTIRIAVETTGSEAGQLLNMLFGNTSLHDDVALVDAAFPAEFARGFGGPAFGIDGIRRITGAMGRPLTCSALKPLGLPAKSLAAIAHTFALAGIDVIKDDHGLADQAAAPFAERVREVQHAVDEANRKTGGRCAYAPSLSGHHGRMCEQAALASDCGVRMFLVAPMIAGVATLAALARELNAPIIAHPALAGGARIAPPLLLGRVFRMFGADATIFPNAGGRFGYSTQLCDAIADAARGPWHGIAPALPVPAGGMTVERVPGIRAQFGADAMLLIGGSLLAARDGLAQRCRDFVAAVHGDAR